MSAFTKVLIVFVCLLSAMFAVSQIVLYTKRENFGEKYRASQQDLSEARTALAKATTDAKDWKDKCEDLRNTSEARISGLGSNLQNRDAEVRRLQVALDDERLSVKQLTGVTEALRADIGTRDGTIEQLRATVTERNGVVEDNLTKITELNTSGAEKDAKIGELENERLELKADMKELAQSEAEAQAIIGELVQRDINIEAVLVPPIDARIVRVDSERGIAVIDKGSASNVKPATNFTVYNSEDGYIGRLVIHDVDEDVAVGRMTLLAEEGKQPQAGDKATTQVQ